MSFFVETSAGRVFVTRSGKGEPLVLVHGWMMSHWYFRPVLAALEAEREVIALDLPGFGESDRPAPRDFSYDYPTFAGVLAEVLTRLELPSVDLLGHSMGGGVALAFAARHPERVRRLILVDACVFPPPLRLEIRLLLLPMVGALAFKHGITRGEFARQTRTGSVRDGRCIDEDWVDYYWERVNRAGGHEAAHACLAMMFGLADSNADPGRLRAPTLLVWGEEDRLVPLAHGKRLARAIGGATLSVIPASGHMPFIERPDELLRQVLPFLAQPALPLVETPVPAARRQSMQ